MKKIHVATSKEYDVLVGDNLLAKVGTLCNKVLKGEKVFLITDDTVNKLYGKQVANDLCQAGYDVYVYITSPGEASKDIAVLYDILEAMAENNIRRTDAVVALGGGVIGDLAGLVASLYMRGIKYVQIPTTLLAMVDSSVGGKTAINLLAGKNLVGTFYQPSLVICDINVAKKLPKKIFSDGMGEVAKYALIGKNRISTYILSNTVLENLEQIILACIKYKADIVTRDECETSGERKILNAGHTVAHAIETKSNHCVSHGEAVKLGLILEAKLAYVHNICDEKTYKHVVDVVNSCNVKKSSYIMEDLWPYMIMDKKNRTNDEVSFVLPCALGKYEVVSLCEEL